MPYTPPSQLSPSASRATTPAVSRSSSYVNHHVLADISIPTTEPRPMLPKSAGSSSYLTKHRRSPSTPTGNEIPEMMTDFQRGISFDPHSSLRQSPPPITNGMIPSGMTISPPESTHNSDDEEVRGRSRELEKGNLAELQAAIRGIRGERKSGSPVRTQDRIHVNGNGKSASEGSSPSDDYRPPISTSQRRFGHARSTTEPNIVFDQAKTNQPPPSPRMGGDSDTDESDGLGSRPPMLRKKSGELVKPALRPHSRRRPSSMPGTPTFSKAVHFDSQLEHIRHFLQVDRPLAVSAGSSPVENYESESEFPFGSEEAGTRSRGPVYEWEIRLANFPPESVERRHLPVFVDRVFLSADKKNLIGIVGAQNWAFQKQVTARFTLDYWKTTSEVSAEFSNDVRNVDSHDNSDRFSFSISLADQANLENKTLFFCVRYNVNGQEFWDSNNSVNYQVDFTKKIKPKVTQQPTGLGARPLNTLPRSRPSPSTSSGRPKSMPISFDDFGTAFENFGLANQSPTSIIGEPKIKLRSPRSKQELVPDAPARRSKSQNPMFSHRYDFNSSLTAAKNHAYAVLGDGSGLPPIETKQSGRDVPVVTVLGYPPKPQKLANGVSTVSARSSAPAVQMAAPPVTSKPTALFTEKPSLSSQSYQELVDKYCFFGTKSSPTMNRTLATRSGDGTADNHSVSDMSFSSAESSGTSTPVPDRSPSSPPSEVSSVRDFAPVSSGSSSPLPFAGSCKVSSTSSSPASFIYPYHQSSSQTLLAETPPATVILG